jgi:GTP-dependent phosphoenolpyruvate carboxykinase
LLLPFLGKKNSSFELMNYNNPSIFSACGKTNLAMLRPLGIPGYKVECIGK